MLRYKRRKASDYRTGVMNIRREGRNHGKACNSATLVHTIHAILLVYLNVFRFQFLRTRIGLVQIMAALAAVGNMIL